MRDKRGKINSYKEILPYLFQVSQDKEFAIRVLKALDSEKEEQQLLDFLRESNNVTVADVYEKMNELTDGKSSFSFGNGLLAKRLYMGDPSEDNLRELIRVLIEEGVFTIETWNLTKEEEKRFADAETGDTIVVDTRSTPALMCDEEAGDIMIPIYSSEDEISSFNKENHSIRKRSFDQIVMWLQNLTDSLERNASIILDGDGKESVVLTYDQLKICDRYATLE